MPHADDAHSMARTMRPPGRDDTEVTMLEIRNRDARQKEHVAFEQPTHSLIIAKTYIRSGETQPSTFG